MIGKPDINYAEALELYLRNDIVSLALITREYIGAMNALTGTSPLTRPTGSSFAMFCYKYSMPTASIFVTDSHIVDTMLRRAYFGGRCFPGFLKFYPQIHGEELTYVDVNSLYPAAMADQESYYPIGAPVSTMIDPILSDALTANDCAALWCGTYLCDLHHPPSPEEDGHDPTRWETFTNNLFPSVPARGPNNNVVWSLENRKSQILNQTDLTAAVKMGWTVNLRAGYVHPWHEPGSTVFGPIKSLYKARLRAKREDNQVLQFVCKILLNSIYGKFAEMVRTDTTRFISLTHPPGEHPADLDEDPEDLLRAELANVVDDYQATSEEEALRDVTLLPNGQVILKFDQLLPEVIAPVQIAAAITANSRRIMNDPLLDNPRLQKGILYTDTDSYVCTNEVVTALRNHNLIDDTRLGAFAIEHNHLNNYWALAPKLYSFTTTDGYTY